MNRPIFRRSWGKCPSKYKESSPVRSHGMITPCAWTWFYVLECGPSLSWMLYLNERMRLNMPNHLLDKLRAVRSPSMVPSMARPPKTYITSSTRVAACPARGDGMDPVHCSSVHFRVKMSNDHVSLYPCEWSPSPPPNLQDIIMRGEGEDERYEHDDTVADGYRNMTRPRKGPPVSGCRFV